jgi:tRNA (guanine37-N1)-methyltransferase
MRFEIVTIFPGFFQSFFENGILRRALAEELVTVGVHDLRAFTHDRHRTVDDRPFGGGEGMVLKAGPLAEALESLGIGAKAERGAAAKKGFISNEETQEHPAGAKAHDDSGEHAARLKSCPDTPCLPEPISLHAEESGHASWAKAHDICDGYDVGAEAPTYHSDTTSGDAVRRTRVILLSAQGRPFTQAMARELAGLERVVLVCGRYEGVDERINELYCDMELSIGDYILSGGELAAAVVVDAVMRLIPGVLGNEASGEFESFGVADAEIDTDVEGVPRSQHGAGGLLDYPHYTRPAEFAGLRAPDVLLNGDHLAIRRWRREQQLRKTLANRPDLLEKAVLGKEDRKLLEMIRLEAG